MYKIPVTIDPDFKTPLGAALDLFKDRYSIRISPNVSKLADRYKTAILAHEYGHLHLKHLTDNIKTHDILKEFQADRFAAERGYGKELATVLNINIKDQKTKGLSTLVTEKRVQTIKDYLEGKDTIPYHLFGEGSKVNSLGLNGPKSNWMKSVISLDIETTGLDETKGHIWEAAFAREDKTDHLFIRDSSKTKEEYSNIFRQTRADSQFGAKQIESHMDFLKNFENATDQKGLFQNLIRQINEPSILLIQNANFENKWLSHLMNTSEDRDTIEGIIGTSKNKDPIGMAVDRSRKLEFVTERNGVRGPKYFYTPPNITSQRWGMAETFNEMFSEYKSGKDINLKGYAEKASTMMSSYMSHFENPERKGTIVAEMMDFSKALYAEAAYQKYITPQALFSRSTNIEFLSQVFLNGEKETHRAASDAAQQLRIFKKFLTTYQDLKSGNISEESTIYLNRLNRSLPMSQETSYLSSLRSGLEELKRDEFFKIKDKLVRGDLTPIRVTSKSGPDEYLAMRSKYPSAQLKNYQDVISFISRGYKGTMADRSIEDINKANYEGIDSAIKDITKRLEVSKQNLSNIINGVAQTKIEPKPFKIPKISLSKNQKIGVGISLGIAGLYMLSGKPKEEKQEKQDQSDLSIDIHKQGDVPNAVFRAYGYNKQYPVVYSGSGFYDWNNRTKHHVA